MSAPGQPVIRPTAYVHFITFTLITRSTCPPQDSRSSAPLRTSTSSFPHYLNFLQMYKYLARSSRQLSQTVRIYCRSFLSRVRIWVALSNFFIREKPQKISQKQSCPRDCSVEWTSDAGLGWSLLTHWTGDDCGHSRDWLSQNGEKQQFKMATMRVRTLIAWNMWFRNYYVSNMFVVCVKINNGHLFFNAFPFENSYYFSSV